MSKDLVVKTGTYTNQQNELKGEFTKIGVVLNNSNGEYILLDPTINLAGVLMKQNAMGEQARSSVMVSIFERDNSSQGQKQGGYQSPAPQQQAPQQSAPQPGPANEFDSDIPF